jgi:glycosyltransferase involved in cell wall biosynthesis
MVFADVSVIVPCYKMGRYVGEALASVGSQTYSGWEIIVVDDAGPEDGTRQAVADFARQFPDHRVEFISHEVNRGVSAARNTAIRHARGKFLAFLDPDDLWLPEKLLKQLGAFESDKNIAVCYSQARILRLGADINYATGIEIAGNPPENETIAAVLGIASGKVMFAFSTLVVKKSVFNEAGGFQENLPFQNEDRLLAGSCALFGETSWVPEPLCMYRLHGGSATISVIQKEIASLVELDVCARLALWLRRQPGGRRIGSRIVGELLLARLRNTFGMPSWFHSRVLIIDLLTRLAFNYPCATTLLIGRMLTQFPVLAFKRGLRRFRINHIR